MKKFVMLFCYPLAMAMFGLWLATTSAYDEFTKLLGNDFYVIERLKRDCELVIPRNKQCKAVVSFVVVEEKK